MQSIAVHVVRRGCCREFRGGESRRERERRRKRACVVCAGARVFSTCAHVCERGTTETKAHTDTEKVREREKRESERRTFLLGEGHDHSRAQTGGDGDRDDGEDHLARPRPTALATLRSHASIELRCSPSLPGRLRTFTAKTEGQQEFVK